ncbi:hypothetical protein LCGC14_1191050 [marine sediment metagenome]|uniref:Uncharacterized protein n=1 Tax=marine sediment metagenome TaxID=412755 RepID=A0A0F9LJD8_9ZZZZ
MLISNLAIGPMSREVIEAVFKYSAINKKQLMLICSRNQIDYNHGYVFLTPIYMSFLNRMLILYPQSDVIICRDHCGPGFGSIDDSIDSVMETIRTDIQCGFDLIHIDLCHLNVHHDEKIKITIDLIEFAKKINPHLLFEIGTDENTGNAETDLDKIINDIHAIREACDPEFYVVQTGSLVKEMANVGSFNRVATNKMSQILHENHIKLKEHNADYLNVKRLKNRKGIVDAVNIAPQLGVIQTQCVLMYAHMLGVDCIDFCRVVAKNKKWQKWLCYDGSIKDPMLLTMIAGHYHYKTDEYQDVITQLKERIDIKQEIIRVIQHIIEHYLTCLGGKNADI